MSGTGVVLGEFELIQRFFSPRTTAVQQAGGVVLGVGDDAALLQLPAHSELAAAVDTLVAGRHFPVDASPHSIGYRSLAVNLSDLAAMGATPAWATLALTLPGADAGWLEGFSRGFFDLADAHGVALVGGDTTSGPLTISVQMMGHVPRGTALRRSGGRVGDLLVVTGTLGDAGAGLAIVTKALAAADRPAADALVRRFEYPRPRVQFGMAARGLASAAMDLSDGLVGDLPKLAAASSLAAHVDVECLPLSRELRSITTPVQGRAWALAAGDDYELLLSVPRGRFSQLEAVCGRFDLALTVIGELRPGNGVTWSLDGEKFVPPAQGYDHFR